MEARGVLLLLLMVAFSWRNWTVFGKAAGWEFSRDDFPSDFVFGAGTSAYQYEGGTKEDGRSPSIWDTFASEGQIIDGSTADVASDGYHKYKEDVKLMRETGLEGYRFSLSWSRILPNGRGEVNPKGIQYYNHVIDELVKNGIEPHVTLYHYDFPQVFQDEYGGWLSSKIIDDFRYFSDVCFKEFGDRVSYWTTMNEPNVVAMYGYDYGIVPPQRCSKGFNPHGYLCKEGNSSTEPYVVVHNMILAHAAAVEVYRSKYQEIQKGKIGINLWTFWADPLTNSISDKMAAQRTLYFMLGWFMDPLVFGDYPEIMRQIAGSRLPSFTEAESRRVKGAFDFVGVNYYFSLFVVDNAENLRSGFRDMSGDMLANYTAYKEKSPIDKILSPDPLPIDSRGLPKLLKYLSNTYGNPIFYIQENGYGIKGEDELNDTKRISYISGFIGSTLKALRDGSDVRGYFVWSFVDLFELSSGFTLRIGIYHVSFKRQCERIPKQSALWYLSFLKDGSVVTVEEEVLQLQLPADRSSKPTNLAF
ncbi:Beta-glucosidase 22 [Platanthera zijinensis]|uniref:Beta-glucosidase 22 n=1 Tax=Platanthera zijinensis TaxID=2320716 RepID=A0AAP0BDF1_9ASPA